VRVLFFGSGRFGVPTLAGLLAAGHDVAAVVTQPPRPAGRGRRARPTPLAEFAAQRGLPVRAVEDVKDVALTGELPSIGARLGVVVAFGQKIGPALLSGLPGGCVNLHASLLPKYRGAAPIQWAIINGEQVTGVTVFRLTERMDAGPILTCRQTPISQEDTYETLHDRLAEIGVEAVLEAVERFERETDPAGEPQDESQASRAPKLRKEDGRLDFSWPAPRLSSLIRGTWPWPGAGCRFLAADGSRDEPVTLARAVVGEGAGTAAEPGLITETLHLAAGQGTLIIRELKPEGGRLMSWPDFVNGRRVRAGDRFV